MTGDLAHHLLTGICHDHIVAAAQMVRLGNWRMADSELASAAAVIRQITSLAAAPEPQPIALEAEIISPIPPILPIAP